jgi:hypothetical protein
MYPFILQSAEQIYRFLYPVSVQYILFIKLIPDMSFLYSIHVSVSRVESKIRCYIEKHIDVVEPVVS